LVIDVGTTFVHNLGVCYFRVDTEGRTDERTSRQIGSTQHVNRHHVYHVGPIMVCSLPKSCLGMHVPQHGSTQHVQRHHVDFWYAVYDNAVLYLVCTYVARIAEPIGGPQPKGWEGGRGGKAQRTIHQMEGSGSKRSRRIAEPARNKTNNATSSSKKRIAAAPYIILDWPQLFTLAISFNPSVSTRPY
jgi:hypothetical protein